MFPISTQCPVRGLTPVTWGIIALNVFVWLYQAGLPVSEANEFILQYGAHPVLLVHGFWPLGGDSAPLAASLFTSQFLHADIFHVGLNMLFFHVFSRVVESLMGSWRFALFYLLAGALAALAHSVVNPQSMTPLIGASGAVAGMLGAHALLLPWDRVKVASRFSRPATLPAYGFTLLWIGLQFLIAADEMSNVAWLAHIGGIAAGVALTPVFCRAGVPLFGRSEGDVEPPGEDEEKNNAAAPTKDEPPPAPQGPVYPIPETTLFGVWAANPPPPEEPPIPAMSLSRGWSAVIAVATLLLAGWAWNGAAHAGNPRQQSRAMEWRARAHLGGIQVRPNPARALAEYREAAKLGDPDVQYRFAELLARGALGERAEAWEWYARAAEGGNPKAMRLYASALIEGQSVTRDMGAALLLLERLGRTGHAWGNYMRGQVYERGLGGVAIDLKEAASQYELACTSSAYAKELRDGIGPACYRLARLLHSKAVPSEKPDAAKRYMERAANEGDNDARNAYGLWLATGDPDSDDIGPGASPDDEAARSYFSLAVAAGHAAAMYNLARMLELNRPPHEADQRARIRGLYERSAAKGNDKAKAALERLSGNRKE